MRLMCWDMDIVHRNDIYLTNADYWSHLGENICYDNLFKSYLDFDHGLHKTYPTPIGLPVLPEKMPYYQGPRVLPPSNTDKQITNVHHCQSLFSQVMTHNSNGLCYLSITPVTSVNLTPSLHRTDMLRQITNFRVTCNKC